VGIKHPAHHIPRDVEYVRGIRYPDKVAQAVDHRAVFGCLLRLVETKHVRTQVPHAEKFVQLLGRTVFITNTS
jgi:hypothetical protein